MKPMNTLEGMIRKTIAKSWQKDLLGSLLECEISYIHEDKQLINIDISTPIDCVVDVFMSTLAAAISTTDLIGTALQNTLKSTKYRIDSLAGYCFQEIITKTNSIHQIAVSEAKDATGESVDNPLAKFEMYNSSDYGLAVDVVDGTTLTALGLDGAYSLAAAAKGLKRFPDLQAYAIMAPSIVLNDLDFFESPEKVAGKLIELMTTYSGKKTSELCFVTHSFDTGKHHTKLIEQIQKRNVKVLIPSPVIVETPYILSCALRLPKAPDAMIGVFGLPEIIINTLLLGIINKEYEIRFRIASSTPLSNPEEKSLDRTFIFSKEENAILQSINCEKNTIYGFEKLVSKKRNAFFVATALTNDPFLDLAGISRKNDCIHAESIICGFGRSVLKIKTKHEMPNRLDYTALFGIKLADVSLVAIISDKEFIRWCESFMNQLNKNNFGQYLRSEHNPQNLNSCGLHATLFEFGVHYGGYRNHTLNDILKNIKNLMKELGVHYNRQLEIIPLKLERKSNAVVMKVFFDNLHIENLTQIASKSKFPDFFNINEIPSFKHITICRLTKYISKKEFKKIDTIITEINKNTPYTEQLLKFNTKLLGGTITPFTNIIS